ncbi:hypothetical protein [Streptomyces antarcticus]|uniref:hypothetical protein n=1 Tax=Streptomyces antarcticus TaxID=2996458 RepID=UPI00226F66F6|nr:MULTISPECIES: hypothetical protein [unclassified Streptomyces]MCY0944652.1 hypothetical protein [Streptomyces sp. H34-AA3]MCZ4087809.1 hypothetical protein [Streptomyces sp. H34-S5]
MTLDAQAWVWNHSRSRGNVRVVMLALGDATTDDTATVRMGMTELVRRVNGARSTVQAAVDAALKSGELVIDEPAAGSRAARYKIPAAVGYRRPTGPNPGPQAAEAQGPGFRATSTYRPETQAPTAPPTGPESGPLAQDPEDALWSENRAPTGPESGPHHSSIDGVNEGVREGVREGAPSSVPPDFARDLVDKITAAQVYPAWDLRPGEWFQVDALLKRSGVDMLAAVAVKAAAKRDVSHARYFLRAWLNLPPAPAAGTVPPPRNGADVIPLAGARKGKAAHAAAMFATAAGITPQEHHR